MKRRRLESLLRFLTPFKLTPQLRGLRSFATQRAVPRTIAQDDGRNGVGQSGAVVLDTFATQPAVRTIAKHDSINGVRCNQNYHKLPPML
jgi:hypothetical protein